MAGKPEAFRYVLRQSRSCWRLGHFEVGTFSGSSRDGK